MIAKKHLGQHFLHDENICRKIVSQVQAELPENVLEIGPGYGAITKYLAKGKHNTISLDVDEDKIIYLRENIDCSQIEFLQKNILSAKQPFESNFAVVGNLPYNIASQIVFKIFEWYKSVDTVFIMVQKEMAERFCSNGGNKNFGFLSILLDTFFDRKTLFDISPNCFTPKPKVNSSFVKLTNKKNYDFYHHFESYKSFLKHSFAMRRKTLKNNLQKHYNISHITDFIKNKRPDDFMTKDYLFLFKRFQNRLLANE